MKLKKLSKILGNRGLDLENTHILEQASHIRKEASGFYTILPLGQLVLDKIIAIIEKELERIDAYKTSLPMLQPVSLWQASGRFDLIKDEVYKLENSTYLLAPTFEEQVCNSIKDIISSYRQLPLRLYQTGPKWRLEKRPKGCLNRLREFIMNDLYTFDTSMEEAQGTFDLICNVYEKVFSLLNIPVMKVKAATGIMGGLNSTEFHAVNDSGEDVLLVCGNCKFSINSELVSNNRDVCPKCSTHFSFKEFPGLELAHCFLLGTKYTEAFQVEFAERNGTERRHPIMGCYGIGVSRLLGALADIHSDLDGLKWPQNIAPFPVSVISKFDSINSSILDYLSSHSLPGTSILIDDREELSVGKRIRDSLLIGIPKTIVIGNSWRERGLLEEYDRYDSKCKLIDPLAIPLTATWPKKAKE